MGLHWSWLFCDFGVMFMLFVIGFTQSFSDDCKPIHGTRCHMLARCQECGE